MPAPLVIIAEMWTGAVVVKRVDPGLPPYAPAELDAIATAMTAQNDGIRPVVREVEQFSFARSA